MGTRPPPSEYLNVDKQTENHLYAIGERTAIIHYIHRLVKAKNIDFIDFFVY